MVWWGGGGGERGLSSDIARVRARFDILLTAAPAGDGLQMRAVEAGEKMARRGQKSEIKVVLEWGRAY